MDNLGIETATVSLNAGLNRIRLTAASSNGAPNMDKLDLIAESCTAIIQNLPLWNSEYFNKWTPNTWEVVNYEGNYGAQLNLSKGVSTMESPELSLDTGIYDTMYLEMKITSQITPLPPLGHLEFQYKNKPESTSGTADWRSIQIEFKEKSIGNFIV